MVKSRRIILLFLIWIVFKPSVKAQDQLIKRDQTKLEVKILEVGSAVIKYKMFNNLSGPTYVEDRTEVLTIVYQSGEREVINEQKPEDYYKAKSNPVKNTRVIISKLDSLAYYKHSNSVSINFLNFLNNEIGLIYQREFYKKYFNIIIPLAFGVEVPKSTQKRYFNDDYRTQNGVSNIDLITKLFEVGIGINYIPTYQNQVNYFIGPAIRYMQYQALNTYYSRTGKFTSNSTINRYAVSVTNGVLIRTKSRLNCSVFISLGFKNDDVSGKIMDPQLQKEVEPIRKPISFYAWFGANVGFSF